MMNKIKIGLTHGDMNGIGYEVLLKTLSDERCLDLFTPVVYGCEQVLNYHRKGLRNLPALPQLHRVGSAREAVEDRLNIVEVNDTGYDVQVQYGSASEVAGQLAINALAAARQDLLEGSIDAVVTAPINKAVVQSAGFPFIGQTEYFAEPFKGTHRPLMLFSCGDVKVALATIHEPLRNVPSMLTREGVEVAILQLHYTLREDFGMVQPRIAVLGLNPHAGEGGLLGREEEKVISPAVQSAWEQGVHAFGPFPADGLWGSNTYEHFDAVLAMYHDQGLIPFKLLAMSEGVNITAGLPIIRTSPDHGTAYDIAGKGVADESSFRNAIYCAIDICRQRMRYKEATADPLPKLFYERGKDNVRLDLSRSEDEL